MNRFCLLFALLFAYTLSAQDTLNIADVDQPPRLNYKDFNNIRGKPTQEKMFLTAVYTAASYPSYARSKRVGATVAVQYVVDTSGIALVEKSWVMTEEEATAAVGDQGQLIRITGFAMVNGQPAQTKIAPPTKNPKKLVRAQDALRAAAEDTIRELPRFVPASHAGEPVVARDVRYYVFNLE